MGKQVHKGERKPHGFWQQPEVRKVFADFVAGRIVRAEAYRRLEILHYSEPMATLTFEWYLRKFLRETRAAAGMIKPPIPEVEHTSIGQGGRVVIPAPYREALGLKEGAEVSLWMEEGELRLLPSDQALRRAQTLFRRRVPPGRSLADELIADRRREARNE